MRSKTFLKRSSEKTFDLLTCQEVGVAISGPWIVHLLRYWLAVTRLISVDVRDCELERDML